METHNYQIGIEINTSHINAVLVFQQSKQWKISEFWQFPLPLNDNIDTVKLRNILTPWRKTLPSIDNVIISLPAIYESYHTIPLPNLISLTPAACYRLAQLRATSYTQTTKTPVSFDYRQYNKNLAIHLCHKTPLDTYIALFSKLNLPISAIDIPACALRYLATYLDISPNSPLIYSENKKMYWVSSDDDMPHYNILDYNNQQEQEICLQQLITKYHWPLEQCYFAGDNRQYFCHQVPIWPDRDNALFQNVAQEEILPLIALGLALRPKEALCIK